MNLDRRVRRSARENLRHLGTDRESVACADIEAAKADLELDPITSSRVQSGRESAEKQRNRDGRGDVRIPRARTVLRSLV